MYVRIIMCTVHIQKWRKGWVVIRTKELLKCTLECYKDEDHWLAPSKSKRKIAIRELLKDIVDIKPISSSYKRHIMGIVFENYAVLICFKSRTTMESWITKLNNIRGLYCISYFLRTCIQFMPLAQNCVHNNYYVTEPVLSTQKFRPRFQSLKFYNFFFEHDAQLKKLQIMQQSLVILLKLTELL